MKQSNLRKRSVLKQRQFITCNAHRRMREIGLKSLKQTFSHPGVSMLHSKSPRSSPKTVSAIETTMRKRRMKKKVVQNLPTSVEWEADCSRSFSTICQAMIFLKYNFLKLLFYFRDKIMKKIFKIIGLRRLKI